MGNHIFAYEDDFVTPTAVTAVSEATGREVENITTWARPHRLFIGTGAYGSETIVIDFGTTKTLQALFIDNANCVGSGATVDIEGNATDSWGGGGPSYSDTFSETSLMYWGRQKLFCDLSSTTWASTGYRYMRLVPGGIATDGASVLKVGGVTPVSIFTTWTENVGFPLEVEPYQPVDVQPRVGAPPEVSILGEQRFVLSLSQPQGSSSMDDDVQELLNVGTGKHVLFYRNNGNGREAYMCRRTTRNRFAETGPRTRSLQNVVFEEVA